MKKVLYSQGGNDEHYTPNYGVQPILEYILDYKRRVGKEKLIVWCPFDTSESEFVTMITRLSNVKVIKSHIEEGKDFFTYEPKKWDIIVSNPPFKNKKKFFERALNFNKPFALLMTNTWLNDSGSKIVYLDKAKQMQLLMFNNRIKFTNPDGRDNNKITFSSSYYCCDFLPQDLILYGNTH